MEISTIWWILAGLAVVAELLTGTIYLLMIALGLAAGAGAAHLNLDLAVQIAVAALVALVCMAATRAIRRRRGSKVSSDPAAQLDIGSQVHVTAWLPDGSAQVQYRGALWRALPAATTASLQPGLFRVVALQGNQLVIEPVMEHPPAR